MGVNSSTCSATQWVDGETGRGRLEWLWFKEALTWMYPVLLCLCHKIIASVWIRHAADLVGFFRRSAWARIMDSLAYVRRLSFLYCIIMLISISCFSNVTRDPKDSRHDFLQSKSRKVSCPNYWASTLSSTYKQGPFAPGSKTSKGLILCARLPWRRITMSVSRWGIKWCISISIPKNSHPCIGLLRHNLPKVCATPKRLPRI